MKEAIHYAYTVFAVQKRKKGRYVTVYSASPTKRKQATKQEVRYLKQEEHLP